MSLDNLRKRIDDIDASIIELISDRIRVAGEIGREKSESNQLIEDRERERLVLARVRQLAKQQNIREKDAEDIFQMVMTASKRVQGTEVVFQGEPGAYAEEAAFRFFDESIVTRPVESLEETFQLVETGEVPYAVVPVENSLEGIVSRVYDMLLDTGLAVCGEVQLRIVHCLISTGEAGLDTIRRVYSHPQALAQSRTFLRQLNAEMIPTYNTAASVKMVKEQAGRESAAVASMRAAQLYDMKTVASGIEDNPNNFTRFFVMASKDMPPSGDDKTSIIFTTRDKPGSLMAALEEFSSRRINLTKLESRPTRQKPWEYNFYVDLQGHREDEAVKAALAGLDKCAIFVKVLGSYPKAS
ncbi:prephenate dehydratase [Chloroflexota bacterium]